MDMVLFGAGCMILGGASVGLLGYALWYIRKRGDQHDEG